MSGITVTKDNFETEVLNSPVPVLLDFWAEWCGPCKMIGPVIEEIAGEYSEKLKVGKVNVDEENALADRHGITSIPTLVIYKDGALANQKTGAVPKNDIINFLKDFI